MSTSISFTTGGFYVQSVTPVAPARVRIRFTADPKATSPSVTTDGLNTSNYLLSGPTTPNAILSITPVSGDTQALDLILSGPLPAGTWTLTVFNVVTVGGTVLSSPTSGTFSVLQQANVTSLTAGVEGEDASTIIRKHLAPELQGANWDAIIAAFATGDDLNWQNAQLAFDQLFLSTASGKYLDRQAANRGFRRPENMGMVDALFRKLAIQLSTNKITHTALREIMEVFYGTDSVRAYVETTLEEPFQLTEGQDLIWLMDEKVSFTLNFEATQFAQISAATGVELAAVITKSMRDQGYEGYALAVVNPITGGTRVRIYSASLGLKSFARVTGGKAQPRLRFPTFIDIYNGSAVNASNTWDFSAPVQNTTRIAVHGVGATLIDLSGVRVGDYLVIGPGVGGAPTGTYTISNVFLSNTTTGSYVEIPVSLNYTVTALVQNSNYDYQFFRPTKTSTNAGSRTVVVAQTTPNTIDVQIPATSQAVSRNVHDAGYGRANTAMSVSSYLRDGTGLLTINGTFNPVPAVGSTVFLDGFKTVPTRAWVSPGTPGTYPAVATADASYGPAWSATQTPPSPNAVGTCGTLLGNGDLLIAGGYTLVTATVTVVSTANRIRILSPITVTDGSEANGATRNRYQWIATASLATARSQPKISTLLDGRALVTGGFLESPSTNLSSTELYNPQSSGTGVWSSGGNMSVPRIGHTQTTLNSGKVIVTGGAIDESTATNSVDIFDPTTLTWAAGPAMSVARFGHQAIKLKDGRLMVIGGETLANRYTVDANTLAYWPLDEASGTAIADVSGNSINLTATAAGTIALGKVGNARNLGINNASGGTLGANATALTSGDWTVQFWLPGIQSASANGAVIAYTAPAGGTSATNTLLMIGLDATRHLFWRWENGSNVVAASGTSTLITGSLVAPDGVFLALRKKTIGSTWYVDLFWQNAKIQSWSGPVGTSATGGTSSQWYLNYDPRNAGHYNGPIDEVKVSNIARTDDEIHSDYYASKGWASRLNLSFPSSTTLNSTEIYDPASNKWIKGPSLTWTRSNFVSHLLPDGRVLVVGGAGRRPEQAFPSPIFTNSNSMTKWPHTGIDSTEIYDPATNSWSIGPATPGKFSTPVSYYVPEINSITLQPNWYVSDMDYEEPISFPLVAPNLMGLLDLSTMKWTVSQLRLTSPFNVAGVGVLHDKGYYIGGGIGIGVGGMDFNASSITVMSLLIVNPAKWSADGINGIQKVVTSSANKLTFNTPNYPYVCTPNVDPNFGYQVFNANAYTPTTYSYYVTNIAKTTGTVTLTVPSTTGLLIGQTVFFNSTETLAANYPSGAKTITALTATTISYVEGVNTVGGAAVIGPAATIPKNVGATVTSLTQTPRPVTDLGPYVYDPDNGLAATATSSTLSVILQKSVHYDRITVGSNTAFPTSGYVVLGFGTASQSRPIKFSQKIGTTQLLFDFAYPMEFDYAIGTDVMYLYSNSPFVPADPTTAENLYLTATPAGLAGALKTLDEASASGIDLNIDVVYPGDRGLGGEGYPDSGDGKLSDVTKLWSK